ncbi:MAG TPA: hypothetical protein VJY39_12320 [Acidisphaera sp.]|nr:hypothetical protein [Acidisphaera sp.]
MTGERAMIDDAHAAAGMICNSIAISRLSDQMERRRERDAVIDDLINRHNALAATNAALQADYNALHEQFQKLSQDHEHQARRIKELERQLAHEREEARITIRDLRCQVQIMQPVFTKYHLHYELGLP